METNEPGNHAVEPIELKSIELAFNAVLKEYEAIREAALSRDQYRNSLMNYFVALLSAAILVLDYIISSNLFFVFLAFAVLISTLGLIYIFNGKLNTYLLSYEHSVLRRQAEDLLRKAEAITGTGNHHKVMQWQEYYRDLTFEKHKWDGRLNLLTFGLPGTLPTLGSVAFFFGFFVVRAPGQLQPIETVFLVLSTIFVTALILVSFQAAIAQQKLWADIKADPAVHASQHSED